MCLPFLELHCFSFYTGAQKFEACVTACICGTDKHHGEVDGCLLQVDYAAAAMFALMDMATAGQDAEGKRVAFEQLLGNLGRMAARVEVDGVAGIMGGVVRLGN